MRNVEWECSKEGMEGEESNGRGRRGLKKDEGEEKKGTIRGKR